VPSPDFCAAWGFLVSWAVEVLKKVPWVKANPQWAALVASALVQVALHVPGTPPYAVPVREIVICILTTWAASIATHEVIVEPVQKR
jgi:coenzyme F420-reducing hydrogenase gamma subunit